MKLVRSSAALLVVLLLATVASPSLAFGAPPDDALDGLAAPERAAAEALLGALRNPATRASFVEGLFAPGLREFAPLEGHLDMLAQIAAMVGDGRVSEVVQDGPGLELRTTPSGAAQPTVVLSFELDPGSGKLMGLGAREFQPLLDALPEVASWEEAAAHLDRMGEAGMFSGVALVSEQGESRLHRAWGEADRVAGVANTTATRFDVGSITKALTATTALRLRERGAIDLDEPIARLLPEIPAGIGSKVTPRLLLQMRSGYGDYFSPAFVERRERLVSMDQWVGYLATIPLAGEIGGERIYSNAGYALLGAWLERATGVPYRELVRREVFEPAGMTGSCFCRRGDTNAGVATGYTAFDESGELSPNVRLLSPFGSPAGGSLSTAEDLRRFREAIEDGRLLEPSTVAFWRRGFVEASEEAPEGPSRGGIAGGAPGVSAVLLWDGGLDRHVVVLANRDEPISERVGRWLMGSLRE